MTMVFGVIFLLLVSMVVSTVLGGMVTRFAGEGKVVGFVLDIVLSLIVYTGVFALLFKYLPDVKIRYRDVWLGAIFTAVLFTIGKYLLTLYLTKGSTASAYGAAGSLAALLIWVYYSAQILFFGAEFTQRVREEVRRRRSAGARRGPDHRRAARPAAASSASMISQAAKEAETSQASQRGAAYPRAQRRAVPERRVVTITRPTPEAQQGVRARRPRARRGVRRRRASGC